MGSNHRDGVHAGNGILEVDSWFFLRKKFPFVRGEKINITILIPTILRRKKKSMDNCEPKKNETVKENKECSLCGAHPFTSACFEEYCLKTPCRDCGHQGPDEIKTDEELCAEAGLRRPPFLTNRIHYLCGKCGKENGWTF